MNGVVYQTTPEVVAEYMEPDAMPWVQASRPLLIGIYKDECVCIFGTIPTSILGDSAYIWLWTPADIPKIAFARHVIRTLPKLLSIYSKLICNCYSSDSARWLRSLGAQQSGPNSYTFWRQ